LQTNTIHITNDGSNTLFSETFGETYHSIFGAKAESEHIFIQSALRKWTEQQESETNKPIRILEFGFGTGLNAFLTAKQTNQKIEYVTIEKFPIEKDI
jgi:tRNA U34 5-methylaminomethyl-2-thiouridine-forming methyltransferase MnmC